MSMIQGVLYLEEIFKAFRKLLWANEQEGLWKIDSMFQESKGFDKNVSLFISLDFSIWSTKT